MGGLAFHFTPVNCTGQLHWSISRGSCEDDASQIQDRSYFPPSVRVRKVQQVENRLKDLFTSDVGSAITKLTAVGLELMLVTELLFLLGVIHETLFFFFFGRGNCALIINQAHRPPPDRFRQRHGFL